MECVEQFYSKTDVLYVKLQFHYVSSWVLGIGQPPCLMAKGSCPRSCAVLLFDGCDNCPG